MYVGHPRDARTILETNYVGEPHDEVKIGSTDQRAESSTSSPATESKYYHHSLLIVALVILLVASVVEYTYIRIKTSLEQNIKLVDQYYYTHILY